MIITFSDNIKFLTYKSFRKIYNITNSYFLRCLLIQPYYGIVGNSETMAFIGPSGSIDWWCIPRFHGLPVFAKALNSNLDSCLEINEVSIKGEQIFVKEEKIPVFQKYIGKTNILSTNWKSEDATYTVLDFMPIGKKTLVRLLKIEKRGRKYKYAHIALGFNYTNLLAYGKVFVKYDNRENIFYFSVEESGHHMCISSCIKPRYVIISGKRFKKGFLTEERSVIEYLSEKPSINVLFVYKVKLGDYFPVYISYGDYIEEAVVEVKKARNIPPLKELRREEEFWKKWVNKGVLISIPDKDLEDAFYRSLLVLKLLTDRNSGGIIAAATTSFPTSPGTDSNWDYRYVWIRDGVFAAEAFDITGYHKEARKFYEFILERQRTDGYWKPLYSVDGGALTFEYKLPHLTDSHGGAVRFGNAAAAQFQIDSPGLVLSGMYLHYLLTGDEAFIDKNIEKLIKAARWILENWNLEENGIWEERLKKSHWLFGKILCYAGLYTAFKILRNKNHELAENFRQKLDIIRKAISLRGWSKAKGAFLQKFDDDSPLDVSALALVFYKILDTNEEKIKKTVEQIEKTLSIQKSIVRYEKDYPPFYLSTLWMARFYAEMGIGEKVLEYLKYCINYSTDLKLMAERYDPIRKVQRGNFPQAYSHEELIKAVMAMLIRWDDSRVEIAPAIPRSFIFKGFKVKNAKTPYGIISYSYRAKDKMLIVTIDYRFKRDALVHVHVLKDAKLIKSDGIEVDFADGVAKFFAFAGEKTIKLYLNIGKIRKG